MLRNIVGTKDIQANVMEMREQFPTVIEGIIESAVDQIKSEFKNEMGAALHAMEVRLANDFRRLIDANKPNTNKVIEALDKRERNKERKRNVETIKSKLAIIYAKANEIEIFTKSHTGNLKLTKAGESLYEKLYKAVILLAGLHGSKSHMKIANRSNYNKFADRIGLSEELTKKRVIMTDGLVRESVFVDILHRKIVDKFVSFLESEFLDEREAN